MTTLQATTAVDEFEEAMDRNRNAIMGRPDEIIRQSIAAMTGARDKQAARRVELEAEHRTRIEQLNAHYGAAKDKVNASIAELERQLGVLRNEWAALSDEERSECKREEDRWAHIDAQQRKLIAAQDAMLDTLRD